MRILVVLLCGLLAACSTSTTKKRDEDVRAFLSNWSELMLRKDPAVRKLFDPSFEFPDIILDDSSGVWYSLHPAQAEITRTAEDGEVTVIVPYFISKDDSRTEIGNIILQLDQGMNGYFIRDMSRDFANEISYRNRILAMKREEEKFNARLDSLMNNLSAVTSKLQKVYDTVVFFAKTENEVLFYVADGHWVYPYGDQQYDSGNYKLGVVTPNNKVIVPVEYSKIYNPGGTVYNAIEVERKGKRGLYSLNGKQILPAEFDGIYPSLVNNVMVQVRQGEKFGWVDMNGKVSFDPNSHGNKTLFESPVKSKAILKWEFDYPSIVSPLSRVFLNKDDLIESTGVIVYPSYLRDLGLTPIAHNEVINEFSDYGFGMTNAHVEFNESESLSDTFFGIVSLFMESGADARGYQFATNDLTVVNPSMQTLGRSQLLQNSFGQDPCEKNKPKPGCSRVGPGLYQVIDTDGKYSYFKILQNGQVEKQETNRTYPFTKFVRIDESYFRGCKYEDTGVTSIGKVPNVVLISGLSYEDLDIMRNEVFAEYGLKFKSPKWQKYFGDKSWYKPLYDNVDEKLSEIEKENVKFILEYQRTHKDLKAKRDSIIFGWAG